MPLMEIPIKSQSNLNRSFWEEDFLNAANQNASLALAAIKQNYVKYHFIDIPAKFDWSEIQDTDRPCKTWFVT
jgi:hypothetical protein